MLGQNAVAFLLKSRAPSMVFAVRWNCPWHRSNWKPHIFPFRMKERLEKGSLEARLSTPGGREIVMRRILREQPFLGWNHDNRPKKHRLSYPL
ncbi:unnamed protein product [Bursaphelenchus xylophilus]|uniref:(pine wood nematode) hypothetical protein n=1 Tax=Bursaphelenchus xylophilus TaxID=6326 RepID=A0A1I7SEB9_BURXY|nr:unnamed protein product [Bursaphelenchus xylophilus]CAG9087463.1 unnamed protein product [Bursaphelenchus xylophilus]